MTPKPSAQPWPGHSQTTNPTTDLGGPRRSLIRYPTPESVRAIAVAAVTTFSNDGSAA